MKSLRSRLAVRPIEPRDVRTIMRWMNDPRVAEVVEDEPLTPRQRQRHLQRLVMAASGTEAECGWIVRVRGRDVGFVHVMWINWVARTAEIDLVSDLAFKNSAVGFLVMLAAGHIVFERLNLNKAYAFIHGDNAASLAPLSRLMQVEATLAAASKRGGRRVDVHVVAMTAEAYRRTLHRPT